MGTTWGAWIPIGAVVELWSGSFSSGGITVPNIDKYKIVIIDTNIRPFLCVVTSNAIIGLGGYPLESTHVTLSAYLERAGTTLYFITASLESHFMSSAHAGYSITVTKISGVM